MKPTGVTQEGEEELKIPEEYVNKEQVIKEYVLRLLVPQKQICIEVLKLEVTIRTDEKHDNISKNRVHHTSSVGCSIIPSPLPQ